MVEYLAIFWQAKVCLEYVGIHAILMEDQHIRMTSPVGRFFGWFVRTERRRTSRHLFLQNGFWWTISNWLLISRIYSRNFCWPNSLEIWALPLPIKSHNCELNLYLWSLFGDFKGISTHIYIYVYVTCSLGRCFLLDQMGRNRISLRFVGIFGLEPRIGYSGFNVAFLREANG